MSKDGPKKKKWRFHFPNRGKQKQYFNGEGDTLKQGWSSAMRKMIAKHGHMALPFAHKPLGWDEIKEGEDEGYKSLSHTIREIKSVPEVIAEDVIAFLRKKGYVDVQKQGSGIATIHPDAVKGELETLKKQKKISTVPPVYAIKRREAASELEEGLMDPKPCPCGSGKSSWWESDAKGHPLARVCEKCFERKMKSYRPEVLTNPSYKHTEDDEPQDGDYAPWERDLYEEQYLEERRVGPTKNFTRERQRVGAKRAQAMKSTRPKKVKKLKGGRMVFVEQYLRNKKKIVEAVATDQGPEHTVVKTVRDDKTGTSITKTTTRADRRKIIDTTAANSKVPKKFGGYRNWVNHYTGLPFNN